MIKKNCDFKQLCLQCFEPSSEPYAVHISEVLDRYEFYELYPRRKYGRNKKNINF